MKEFKTFNDVFSMHKKEVTRDEFEKIIKSGFVEWYNDVTGGRLVPLKINCNTYDIKLKSEEEICIYVFVEDEEDKPYTEVHYEIGEWYKFGELWDGNGNGQQILADGCMAIDNGDTIEFWVMDYNNDDILDTIIEVTDIY